VASYLIYPAKAKAIQAAGRVTRRLFIEGLMLHEAGGPGAHAIGSLLIEPILAILSEGPINE